MNCEVAVLGVGGATWVMSISSFKAFVAAVILFKLRLCDASRTATPFSDTIMVSPSHLLAQTSKLSDRSAREIYLLHLLKAKAKVSIPTRTRLRTNLKRRNGNPHSPPE
jgi:hypothetical protein